MKPRILAVLLVVGALVVSLQPGATTRVDHSFGADTVLAAPLSRPVSDSAWNPSVKVNDNDDPSFRWEGSIAVDASGNSYAIWTDERNGDADIYFSYRPAGGSWGTNVRVNDDTGTASQWCPSIAVEPSGNAYSVWTDNRDGNSIHFSYRPAGGSWGPNVEVADPQGGDVVSTPLSPWMRAATPM